MTGSDIGDMMKIFIDVDNTILEHTTFYNSKTEGRLHNIFNLDPVSNETAIKRMYEGSVCSDVRNLKLIFERESVYILTKTSNSIYEKYKRIRLAKLLGITVEELLDLKDVDGNPKYITVPDNTTKSAYLMGLFKIDSIENFILVDDYSKNIIEWEDDGGIGIKFNNQYNSNFHPKGGLIISNFKLFTYMLEGNEFENLVIEPKIAYYFKKTYPSANFIDYLDFVKKVVVSSFGLERKTENTKSSFTDFLNSFYNFTQEYRMEIYGNYTKKMYRLDKLNILINPFDYGGSFIKMIPSDRVLTIAQSRNGEDPRVRDVYISIPTELYTENTYEIIVKCMKVLEKFGGYKGF